MNFDLKEKLMLSEFKNQFENQSFDEQNVYSFLVFVRDHIKYDKVKYRCILELGDFIAHRHRNKGLVMDSISSAIDNHYETLPFSNTIKGYNGIIYANWEKEWNHIGRETDIMFSKNTIRDISICVLSLMQFSEFDDQKGHKGIIKLIQGNNNALCASTTEGNSDSFYVSFFIVEGVKHCKVYDAGIVADPVYAKRVNGILRLINDKGEYLV